MTHEKLVAGTSSPTRYTKIIRNPGAGTKYNRTYQETDYVSRYTKTVAGGKDYVPPAPPEPEYEALAVNQKAVNNQGNVYEVGQTVAFTTATYTGGSDSNVYRWRFQTRENGSDSWVNGSWTMYGNTQMTIVNTLTKAEQLRFQCQARDASQDPVPQVNSFGPTCNIAAPPDPLSTEIGNTSIHVNDIFVPEAGLTLLMNDPVPAEVFFDGDADPTYLWEGRNEYPLMVGSQTKSTILTFPQEGVVTITCTLRDNTATDSPSTAAGTFYIVDAKTFEELKSKGEI